MEWNIAFYDHPRDLNVGKASSFFEDRSSAGCLKEEGGGVGSGRTLFEEVPPLEPLKDTQGTGEVEADWGVGKMESDGLNDTNLLQSFE